MARVTPKMGLRVWDQGNDAYDHTQQADNWAKVDYHDHTPGRGVQIPADGIEAGAIQTVHLSNEIALNALLPPGIVLPYGGTSSNPPPSGYLFCNGASYDGTLAQYSRLYAAIGIAYGGTGASNFHVPDFTKVFLFGEGSGFAIGASGGEQTHLLTAAESGVNGSGSVVAAVDHQHNIHVGNANNTGVTDNFPGLPVLPNSRVPELFAQFDTFAVTEAAGGHGHNLTARIADAAHNNMPPYVVVSYLIKL